MDNLIFDQSEVLNFNRILRKWYLKNHRNLPWRNTTEPYKIWLSEIILQQTRVLQGLPYYEKFVTYFPTVEELAMANEQEVLRLWQGLGYYSRARNLHYTAKIIFQEYDSVFPATFESLLRLKGLGDYTAAAIASFAFNVPVPAIDGNVYRVMSRIFGLKHDILSVKGKKEFFHIGLKLISQKDPATYNQAMIEFGALQCVPISPKCMACPFNDRCYAYQNGEVERLPVKIKKLKIKHRHLNYLVLNYEGQLVLRERRGEGIWEGLYDFPLIETEDIVHDFEDFPTSKLLQELQVNGIIEESSKSYVHLLTHQKLNVKFWPVQLKTVPVLLKQTGMVFYEKQDIENLPKPILIDQYLKQIGFL